MKIEKEEVVLVPIRKTAHCEKCGVEMTRRECRQEMRHGWVGEDWGFWSAKIYEYTCPQCGATEESDKEFPRIIYEHRTKEVEIVDEKR